MSEPDVFFQPEAETIASSQLTAFARFCEARTERSFPDQTALQRFAVGEFRSFWRLFLEWSGLPWEGSPEPVCVGEEIETAVFLPEVRLSYAASLLRRLGPDDDAMPAITAVGESGERRRLTRGELRERVARVGAGLRGEGLEPGDRVVAVARNSAETVEACLAAAAIGCTWSSTAPDLGTEAILNRFRQLEPSVMFAHTEWIYQGVRRPMRERLREIASALPSLRTIVFLDSADGLPDLGRPSRTLEELASAAPSSDPFPLFPFNHPLFILFSSGTTGLPKCIVHGAGGTLLEHHKEHRLHGDLAPGDRMLFQTSTGWMMWNWQLSALACGTELVLYDGSVTHPVEDALWQVVGREEVTVFGTSPSYIQFCRDAGMVPREAVDLTRLRAMQSTGSVLFDAHYDWVRENVKPLPLQSISGGTDIIGCFVLGSPNLPVWRGESQCVSLGLDVRALPPAESPGSDTGELVCVRPFPSRPLGLFGDPDGRRFHEAYFAQNEGFWTHGDAIQITDRGTARILGRSDGILNIRGVRIGPAEIYHVLQDVPEIAEAMALEQQAPAASAPARLVLLLVLKPGFTLDRPLVLRVKKELSQRASPVHAPAVVAQVSALPTTFSGKRSERAARDAMHGRPVQNAAAIRNPETLEEIRTHPVLRWA